MPNAQEALLLLSHYGYFLLLPAAVIEGPIVTVIAGALVYFGYMGFAPAYVIIVVGDTIGDVLHYALGRWGGRDFLLKWGKYIGIKEPHVESLERVFDGHEGKAFLLGKLAHGFGGALLVAAGMVEMPLSRFLYWNVVGTVPKSLLLMLLGYYFAHALSRVNSALDLIAIVTVALGVVATYVWIMIIGKREPEEV